MQIIVLTNRRGGHGQFRLGGRAAVFFLLAAVFSGLLLVYGGFRYGAHSTNPRDAIPAAFLHQQLQRQRAMVSEAVRHAEDNLNAMALRLGQLQARLIRLEALGERLVVVAGVAPEEFQFGEPPGLGGPATSTGEEQNSVPDFIRSLEEIELRIGDFDPKYGVLEGVLMNRQLEARTVPAGRPVRSGWISSYYGYRRDPLTGKRVFHHGIDIAGPRNSDVLATAAGVVTWAGFRRGYGKLVEINHGGGYVTRYAHNQENLVQAGETVEKGQTVARMGASGRATGPHVHFEVLRDDKLVNPFDFVQKSAERS